jgi:hypothetical protein
MALRKKKDDDASRAFWTLAEKTAQEVAAWPAWKRGEKAATPPRNEAKKTLPNKT